MLSGVRVLEFVDELTADAGRMLAQLGADVVVLEPPEGSDLRRCPPFVDDEPGTDRSLRWFGAAVGKRGIAVDLDAPAGLATASHLVAGSDIVIEGTSARLDDRGIGWSSVDDSGHVPVWVSVTPYGRDDPRSARPVTDLTLLAGGGPMWNCGYDDHSLPPVRGAGDQAYRIGGWYAAIGALVALRHRSGGGGGQLVDVSVDAACNVTSEHATYNWMLIGEECVRQTGRHAYYVSTAPVQVACSDGRYATTGVLPRMPADFDGLHRWLDELDLVDQLPEAVFLEMAAARDQPVDAAMVGEDDEVTAMLGAARSAIRLLAANLPAEEFFLQSQRRGFPAGAIYSPEEAFESEHMVARGLHDAVEHPELRRVVRYPGVPFVSDVPRPGPTRRPPLLGEHDGEVDW